jgi:hypothetical protein
LVDVLVASVVSLAWKSLRVLVAQARTHSLHHSLRCEVLTSN